MSNIYKNIKSFKIFESLEEFLNYTEKLYSVENWIISDLSYQERVEKLKNKTYFNIIKNEFNSKKLLNKELSNNQLVSYLDTMHLMHFIIKEVLEENFYYNEEMKIIMEYLIPGNEKERVDYIIAFRNQLLLLEFSKANYFKEIKKIEKEKMQQVITYKERISKNLTNNINIIIQTFIYLPTNDNNDNIENNIDYIEGKLNETIDIINNLINKATPFAIEQLDNNEYDYYNKNSQQRKKNII